MPSHTYIISRRLAVFAAAVVFGIVWIRSAGAAEVQLSVDSKSTYVGLPVTLSIIINDANDYQRPEIPDIPGVEVEISKGTQTSSSVTIINGRMTQTKSETLQITFTPSQPGKFTIPAFPIVVDGNTYDAGPIDITVAKSETGDLLFAEVQADRTRVYLGQPLQLTLRIWAKPFRDQQFNVTLNGDDMWMMLDRDKTQWGPFAESIAKLRNQFGTFDSHPREVQRELPDGTSKSYYFYNFTATMWPEKAGPLLIPAVRLVMMYPQRLTREFGMRLSVAQSRPVAVSPETPAVEVVNPPAKGQPSTFAGLVGKFDFSVSAKPTSVAVGDPITLTMTIRDRSAGGAKLDVIPPPPLERLTQLTDDFKLPTEPLAGTVNQRSKVFTQTIRPKSDHVSRIPAIPLTYFDPETEQYVTTNSEPIPLTVKAGSKMMLNDVVGGPAASTGDSASSDLTESAGGLLANYSDLDAMLADQRFTPGWGMLITLLAPPLLVAGIGLRRVIRSRSPEARAAALRRAAARRAISMLRHHRTPDHAAAAAALGTFVSDRFGAPPGTRTAEDIAQHLLARGVPVADAEMIRTILTECEQAAYAGAAAFAADGVADRAAACIRQLDRSRAR